MRSPFKFLDAYIKEDKDFFFGRDTEVEELYDKIHRSKLLLVYGASGTGKTSVIQCGLGNYIQDTDWYPILIRKENHILQSTQNKVKELAVTAFKNTGNLTNQTLTNQLESLYLDYFKPLYLIYDQFEELFISGSPKEIEDFFHFIKYVLTTDIQAKIIVVIREEYLAYLTNWEHLIPELFDNRARIESMSSLKTKEVIHNSCQAYGIQLEQDNTVDVIYKNLLNKDGVVELPHLQVYLDRLYRMAYNADTKVCIFTNDLIQSTGKLEDVLATFLNEQVAELPQPKLGWEVLKLFITDKGTKKSITKEAWDKLLSSQEWNNKSIEPILAQLIERRVIRYRDKENTMELSHDSLAMRIFESLSAEEKQLIDVKNFLNTAFANYKINGSYLTVKDVAYIQPYINFIDKLPNNIQQFVNDSKNYIRRKKLLKTLLIVAIAAPFIALFLFILTKRVDLDLSPLMTFFILTGIMLSFSSPFIFIFLMYKRKQYTKYNAIIKAINIIQDKAKINPYNIPIRYKWENILIISYLLDNQWNKARRKYLKWEKKYFPNENILCKSIFLQDIKILQSYGIDNDNFHKAQQFLNRNKGGKNNNIRIKNINFSIKKTIFNSDLSFVFISLLILLFFLFYEYTNIVKNNQEKRIEKLENFTGRVIFDNAIFKQYGDKWLGYNEYDKYERDKILRNVTALDFSYSNLVFIPKKVLECPNLKHINLLGNYINYANEPTVNKLRQQVKLSIEVNNLNDVQKKDYKRIIALKLINKKLNNISNTILEFDQLEYLKIDANLYSLPIGISRLKKLTKLDIAWNKLEHFPVEITHLSDLQFLDYDHNHLKVLPKEIGNLSNLTQLNLGSNALRSLPEEIRNLNNLTQLDLSYNNFNVLPKEICYLPNLVSVDLMSNNIEILPKEIDSLTNLKTIILMHNNLQELPKEIGALTNLITLNLRNNKLQILPKEIKNLINLKCLDISANGFKNIPKEIISLKNLCSLNIKECTNISKEQIIDFFKKCNKKIILSENGYHFSQDYKYFTYGKGEKFFVDDNCLCIEVDKIEPEWESIVWTYLTTPK